MPSSRKARKAICSLIPSPSGPVYELGSGWGSIAFALARLGGNRKIHAYEISPVPFFFSKGWLKISRLKDLMIRKDDFFNVSLDQAEGVVCYLYPGAMERLKEKFEQELRPGTFVISNSFAVPGWKADKIVEVDDMWRSRIFFYQRGSSDKKSNH